MMSEAPLKHTAGLYRSAICRTRLQGSCRLMTLSFLDVAWNYMKKCKIVKISPKLAETC